jgi:tRNA pseudouridine38-40 synthase
LLLRFMQNIKLTIEYDGTGFVGWQVQPNGPSIQEELEKAIAQIAQERVSTVAAGRTDAGVHARGQVVSAHISKPLELASFAKSLNALLPSQIVVLSAEHVPEDFHARHSARARVYQYFLTLALTAIDRDHCWYVGGFNLDMDLLDQCARTLVGEHDFESFCKNNANVDHFRCTVSEAAWSKDNSSIIFTIRSNRFLYGMVRALVGTMVEIARGHRPLSDMQRILEARDRSVAGMSAPSKGLFLEEIVY